MGCDIHIVIERRWEGRWVGIRTDQGYYIDGLEAENPSIRTYVFPAVGQRNYDFFARLAGVRGEGPVPNGFPRDASDLSRLLRAEWGSDGHSHSWLPLQDFALRWCAGNREFVATMAKQRMEGDKGLYYRLLDRASIGTYDAYSEDDIDDYRVVFWFDN